MKTVIKASEAVCATCGTRASVAIIPSPKEGMGDDWLLYCDEHVPWVTCTAKQRLVYPESPS